MKNNDENLKMPDVPRKKRGRPRKYDETSVEVYIRIDRKIRTYLHKKHGTITKGITTAIDFYLAECKKLEEKSQ